jgi:hypothetical protein
MRLPIIQGPQVGCWRLLRGDMAVGFAFSSRAAELLNLVTERLEAEFPEMPHGQVVRCVGFARESANTTASDLAAYANIVEALARDYLVKLQIVLSGG